MKFPTLSLGLLLVASLAVPVGAQESTPAPDLPIVADSEEAARILYLSNGDVLRARARRSASGWEVQSGKSEWKALRSDAVLRTVLERDVLADAKRLDQQITAGRRPEQN